MKLWPKIAVMGSGLVAALIATATMAATITMAAGDPGAGKPLFTSSGCGGCHGLKDAGAKGGSASNFDQTKPGFAAIVAAIGSPPGGMPPNSLSPQQAEDIAAYIVSVAGVEPGGGGTGGDTGGGNTGGGTGGDTGSKKKSKVRVTLYKSGKLKFSPKTAFAGEVTLNIVNKTKKKQKLSLFRLKPGIRALKVKRDRVKGKPFKKIKLNRSKRTKKVKYTLKTGKYMVIVNNKGNLRKKKYAVLEVKEPEDSCKGSGKSSVSVSIKKNRKIKVSTKKISHETVTLKIRNYSKRKQNLSVIRVPKKSKSYRKLSVRRGRISEKGRVGKKIKINRKRTGRVRSKVRSKNVRLKLKPGTYIVIDNKRGNYKKKRYAVLEVSEPPSQSSCSSQSSGASSGTSTGGQPPADDDEPLPPFLAAGCGGCHALADAGTTSPVASNLDIGMPSKATVVDVVTNGITHEYINLLLPPWDAMPAYASSMTTQEIDELATYISDVTGGGDGSTQPPGRQTVLQMGCGSCHSFGAIGTVSSISTDLDVTKPVNGVVDHGVSMGSCEPALNDPMCTGELINHMPGYRHPTAALTDPTYEPRLTEQEIDDVATYVDEATGEGTGVGGGCLACHTPH